jgi:hypothetical protein
MWKKLAVTAVAVLGMAAPALADEPCAQEQQQTYVQPSSYVQTRSYIAPVVQPTYVQPVYARDHRDDYWRLRQQRRWERTRREQASRQHSRYGRRW